MSTFYHVCFAVQDIDKAAADLTAATGATWNQVHTGTLANWTYRIAFSTAGPPFLELIEGPPGSPWDSTAGPHFHHLGYWSSNITQDQETLTTRGAPPNFNACPYGRPFSYHHLPSIGSQIELVDLSAQPGFLNTWSPGSPAMPPLDPH